MHQFSRSPGFSRASAAPLLVLGATTPVGQRILERGLASRVPIVAVSRRVPEFNRPGLTWLQQDLTVDPARVQGHVLISAGSLELVVRQARSMTRLGRIVALTSSGHEPGGRSKAADTKTELASLAERSGIGVTLLRAFDVYDAHARPRLESVRIAGRDRVPLTGRGLRHPVHADDLARLMVDLVARNPDGFESFDLGGGETLAYPDYARRLASAAGVNPTLVSVPSWLLGPFVRAGHRIGRLKSLSADGLAEQQMDRVVDDTPAREQLGWNPRPFRP